MKLLKATEMQLLDKISIEKIGIPGIVLMENAGKAVADFISGNWGSSHKVYLFCGPGNNGGDGLVVARHLFNRGYQVQVFLGIKKDKLKGDAAINFKIAINMGIDVKELLSSSQISTLRELTREKGVILVDALLGTGAKGSPRGILKEMIELINGWEAVKIAVDLPTGVDADTGEVPGEAVKADFTLTFAYPKRGIYLYPGMDYAGEIKVVDIGIPANILEKEKICISANLLSSTAFNPGLFYRKPSSHKGEFGHLLVLAGAPGLTGAAALTCLSALRVGTGLVTLGIPQSLNHILEVKLTEAMTLPLPETEEHTLSPQALEKIIQFSKKCDAIVLGPGLSLNFQTGDLVKNLLRTLTIPLVLDADGINALRGEIEFISNYSGSLIVTPHPGEMARLTGTSVAEIQQDRIKAALELARRTGKIIVLKGAGTIIAEPEGECWVNTTGNPGMASGGTGDVLAGIIGGFLAQGMDTLTAVKLGVYLHGLAGDKAAEKKGEISLLAQDMIKNLAFAIRSLTNGCC